MATLPTGTYWWRLVGGSDSSWTQVSAGTGFSPPDGANVEVVTVAPSKSATIYADTTVAAGSIADVSASYGTAISVNAAAAFTGTNLIYSLLSGPSYLAINSATGLITGTAPGVDSTDTVVVRAQNSKYDDEASFSVDITSDYVLSRNAVNLYGLGNASGGAISTSTGAPVNYSGTFVNKSGAPITIGSLVLSGWFLTTTGTGACGNDVPCTANIEYPVGVTTTPMLQAGGATITIPNNNDVETDLITLTTPIPDGATFKVNISHTIAAGLKYLTNNGLNGVRTTALRSTLKKEMVFAIGDSIMTNSNGAVTSAASSAGCPSIQMSISGTTAQTYGSSSAANFQKHVALAVKLGATRFISNYGTNDFATNTLAQVQGYLSAMNDAAVAQGILFTQCTILPRVGIATVSVSAMTSVGNELYAVVPDASKFEVGKYYTTSGASPAEYNGVFFVKAIDTGTNTVTFYFVGSATPTATGTIIITGSLSSQSFQTLQANYTGASSKRGLFNAWLRAGALSGGHIEWSDAVESSRDEGYWKVGGESPQLLPSVLCTVVAGFMNTSRFQTNWPYANSTVSGGRCQFISGVNIGQAKGNNGNTGGDFTASSAFTNLPTVGDQLYIAGGSIIASDDGTHPRLGANGFGGQQIIVNAAKDYITALLA